MTSHDEPSWKAPHLTAATTRHNRALFLFVLVLVVATSLYEGLLIKPAVAVALHSANWLSYVVAFLIALAAAVSMMEAGHLQRKARIEAVRSALPMTLIAGWALFGVALTALRFFPEPRQLSLSDALLSGGEPQANATPVWLVPVVMLAVYVGAGLLSRATGHTLLNPIAQAHASARRERMRLERRIAKRRPKALGSLERLEIARGDFAAIAAQRESADEIVLAFFRHLHERARLRMLLPFGDPAVTSAIGQPPVEDETGGPAAPIRAVL